LQSSVEILLLVRLLSHLLPDLSRLVTEASDSLQASKNKIGTNKIGTIHLIFTNGTIHAVWLSDFGAGGFMGAE
jgi:hypothetical protein